MSAPAARPTLAAAFEERAASVGTQVHPATRADAATLVVHLLAGESARQVALESSVVGELPELPLALIAAGLALVPAEALPAALAAADAGLSFAAFGVAETGSVALAAAAPRDRLVSMLPPVHVVVLRASALLPDLDAAGARLRAWTTGAVQQPYVSLVTGASRTSDIERVLTIGVHGPRTQHVVLLSDE